MITTVCVMAIRDGSIVSKEIHVHANDSTGHRCILYLERHTS